MHGSHGQFRKTTPWEESTRIPFILGGTRDRYRLRCGECDGLVNHVDIAPTTLGLCGIIPPDWMRGHDYSDQRRYGSTESMPDSALLQCVIPTGHADSVDRTWRGIVTRDHWKYVVLEGQPWLMFNLNEDPYEQANLAHNTRYRAERRRLHERLAQWLADTDDAFALPAL
jgi:arylsulfatase A-like enzyme